MGTVFAMKAATRAALLAGATVLAGCGWFGSDKDTYTEQPVEVLYNRAVDDLGQQEYKGAAKGFEEVDRQHPYSVWATKAQIMAAFTYYQSNKYDEAIIALDRFIQLHPGHRDIPYAYYLKGLCYYEQISDVGRDQRVLDLVFDKLPVSISLALWTTLLSYLISIPLGIAKAVRHGSPFDVATSARPSVQRISSSGLASARSVGFESGRMIGRSTFRAISRTTDSVNAPATVERPIRMPASMR